MKLQLHCEDTGLHHQQTSPPFLTFIFLDSCGHVGQYVIGIVRGLRRIWLAVKQPVFLGFIQCQYRAWGSTLDPRLGKKNGSV